MLICSLRWDVRSSVWTKIALWFLLWNLICVFLAVIGKLQADMSRTSFSEKPDSLEMKWIVSPQLLCTQYFRRILFHKLALVSSPTLPLPSTSSLWSEHRSGFTHGWTAGAGGSRCRMPPSSGTGCGEGAWQALLFADTICQVMGWKTEYIQNEFAKHHLVLFELLQHIYWFVALPAR